MILQRISVACLVESRIYKIFPCFYKCLKFIHFTQKGGKIYIVTSKLTQDIIE